MKLMSFKKHIPNLLTLCNLICGCIAILLVFEYRFTDALIFILVASVLDFFDGLSARLLKVSGPIGKELDSLADVVTFGVAPFFFLLLFILKQSGLNTVSELTANFPFVFLLLLTPTLSAYRLAKFNVDIRQNEGFIGLNTPTNTLLLISLPFVASHLEWSFSQSLYILIGVSVISALLLNAEIPMISLKFKNLSFKENTFRWALVFLAIISAVVCLLINFVALTFPIIVLLYLIISLINNYASNEIQSRN
jgi:CDP-diacylglycerol---serine O-phosphatidyltransferase